MILSVPSIGTPAPALTSLRPGQRAFLRLEIVGVTTDFAGETVAIVKTLDRQGRPYGQDVFLYVPERELVSAADAAAEVRGRS